MFDVCIDVLFQRQFGIPKYKIIGDDNAPVYFKISETGGDITLKRSVNSDSQTVYKVMSHHIYHVECSVSGVELRTLDYENPGSNPVVLKP